MEQNILIIELILIFLSFKYLPRVKNKMNQLYLEKFNYKLFSPENFKIPFAGSMIIVLSFFFKGFTSIAMIAIGIGLIIYSIYLVYQKTDVKYGSIAAGFYLLLTCSYIIMGFGAIIFLGLIIALLYNSRDRD